MFFAALLLAAAAGPVSTGAGLDARIQSAITKIVREEHPVGAAIGVAKNGKLIYQHAFGERDRETHALVDANTRFEIGSVTKQFTAAAILQLQEAGKLNIDDQLANYFPTFPHASEITLRQLLNQISGLPDYLPHEHIATTLASQSATLDYVASLVQKLDFAPGTQWKYSNTNYFLLGHVVAKVSGVSYEQYVRDHLFQPAGMTQSGFVADESRYNDVAKAYWRADDNDKSPLTVAPEIPEEWAGGAGAIVSTVADLVRWDTALQSGKIVSKSDYALMSSPGVLRDGSKTDYGMGLGINPLLGHTRIWHNGGTLGSFTMNGTYPKDHLDIVVFTNSVDGDPSAIETAALGAIFPNDLATLKQAAPGEDLAFRPRIMHYLDETIHGTMPASEMSADFAKVATPEMQQKIAHMFSAEGTPTKVIFRGKQAQGKVFVYNYRVEFPKSAMRFILAYNTETNVVEGIQLGPAP